MNGRVGALPFQEQTVHAPKLCEVALVDTGHGGYWSFKTPLPHSWHRLKVRVTSSASCEYTDDRCGTRISLCRYIRIHTPKYPTLHQHPSRLMTFCDRKGHTPIDLRRKDLYTQIVPPWKVDACLNYGSVSWCLCRLQS